MAQLIGLEERKDALKQIVKYIKSVEQVNNFLDKFDIESSEYEVSFKPQDSAKPVKAPFITEDGAGFKRYAEYSRRLYISKINELCNKYDIALSDEEELIIQWYSEYAEQNASFSSEQAAVEGNNGMVGTPLNAINE